MAKTLLLIEDSLSIQALVETTFEPEDFDVIVTDNALDGLHKAQLHSPDIVLADASMPDMDGFQLCQSIRQTTSGRHTPVVLLTSSFVVYDKAKGDLVGVTTHLDKPFAPHVLVDLVQQCVPGVPRPTPPPATTIATLPPSGPSPGPDSEHPIDPPAHSRAQSHAWMEPAPMEVGVVSPGAESALTAAVQDTHRLEVPRSVQPLPLHGESDGHAAQVFYHTLGHRVEQLLREALDAQLPNVLAHIMPSMLDTVRAVIAEKMPAMLAELLQQEIDKLKRAVEQESEHA